MMQHRASGRLVSMVSTLLVLVFAGPGWGSQSNPGVVPFLELDQPNANLGFDNATGFLFDWANSGANATPRDCSATPAKFCTGGANDRKTCAVAADCPGGTCSIGLLKSCTCTAAAGCTTTKGGIFDGGAFRTSTFTPVPPSLTTAARGNNTIAAATFGVDELSVDHAIAPNYLDPTAPEVACGTGDPTVYTGMGGETNGDNLNPDLSGVETFGTGSVPNKDDISNVYAIAHQSPVPVTGASTDTNEIYAGFERVVNNGDSHVDLEFLQAPVTLVPSKAAGYPCQGNFKGHRTQGDFLISVDFTTGGTLGGVSIHRWDCGNGSANGTVCDPGRKAPAVSTASYVAVDLSTLPANVIVPTINRNGAVGCGGWACRNADGTEADTVQTNELFELGIDLAALGFRGCISSFLPHTRSSQSFTATLKDFKLLTFNTCAPVTTLTKSVCDAQGMNCAKTRTVNVGDSVVYRYTEKNDGNVAITNPSITDDKCSPVTRDATNDVGSNGDATLDPGETFAFKCTLSNIKTNTTNTAIGHGTFLAADGTSKDVTFCPDPANPPAGTVCSNTDPNCTGGTKGCERDQATVTVKSPSTCLKKSATVTRVDTTVLYTYAEKNDGDIPLTTPSVDDAECTSNGGTITRDPAHDVNSNSDTTLDPGETFAFKCTATFTQLSPSGTQAFIDTATSHGHFTSGGADTDVTFVTGCTAGTITNGKFCDPDETDTKTVTVSAPTVTGGKTSCP